MNSLEETTVTYEDLAAIERTFDEADLEMSSSCPSPLFKSFTNTLPLSQETNHHPRPPLQNPQPNHLSNPQLLASRPRASTARHRPIHPALGLSPPPLLSLLPLSLPLRFRPLLPSDQRRSQIPKHNPLFQRKSVLLQQLPRKEILVSQGQKRIQWSRQRASKDRLEEQGERSHWRLVISGLRLLGGRAEHPRPLFNRQW